MKRSVGEILHEELSAYLNIDVNAFGANLVNCIKESRHTLVNYAGKGLSNFP